MAAKMEIHSYGIVTSICDPSCTQEDMEFVDQMLSHLRQFRYRSTPMGQILMGLLAPNLTHCPFTNDVHFWVSQYDPTTNEFIGSRCCHCTRWRKP